MAPPTTLRALAERAAERGGEVIVAAGTDARSAADKGRPGDYVTEIDLASERTIAAVFRAHDPDIPILAEEAGRSGDLGDRYWVVDPLDGTTNFVHGFPLVGVSVALVEHGVPVAGAVHAPFLRETYGAERGHGAWLTKGDREPEPLSVSGREAARAVVGTGFPFRHPDRLPRYLRAFAAALERFEDLRRPGAASLDLAWTAAGVFDGFFELGLAPWDVAAGGLLIREAGGTVTDWNGGDGWLGGDILAGPPPIHAELLALAREST
ncbi:MAG: monophosphatase [Actinomycetota bacterium]|jgi:myo-inositol-1(or 4)-monophosphatase|nr:monophosphatase [Actinomycetota bacterium]